MRRHPGKNNTDILLMQAVDKIHQILGSAVTTGWREVAGGLITRRVVAWMFHDRQEFGMREAQSFEILPELQRQFSIAQKAIAFFGNAHPRAQMHLVN